VILRRRFQLLTQVVPVIGGGLLNKQAAAILGITEVTLHLSESDHAENGGGFPSTKPKSFLTFCMM
jgi:hypothetical protein